MWAAALRYLILIAERLGLAISIVGGIENLLNQATPNPQTQQIITQTELILTTEGDLGAQITALAAQDVIDHAAILAAVESIITGTAPITLPAVPPAGYGPPNDAALWNAVWNTGSAPGGIVGWTLLLASGSLAAFQKGYAAVYQADEHWYYFFQGFDDYGTAGGFYPIWDDALILSTDTLLGFVTRLNPTALGIFQTGATSPVHVTGNDGSGTTTFMTVDDEITFAARKLAIFGTLSKNVSPIWPGSALATLGTSVALDRTVTLTEAMDGVIVTLTSVPPGKPTYVLGGLTATAHIGQIAFVADNGAAEYPQNLSFASEIYVPLALVGASAAVLRTIPGVAGTVQAWTRIP